MRRLSHLACFALQTQALPAFGVSSPSLLPLSPAQLWSENPLGRTAFFPYSHPQLHSTLYLLQANV